MLLFWTQPYFEIKHRKRLSKLSRCVRQSIKHYLQQFMPHKQGEPLKKHPAAHTLLSYAQINQKLLYTTKCQICYDANGAGMNRR